MSSERCIRCGLGFLDGEEQVQTRFFIDDVHFKDGNTHGSADSCIKALGRRVDLLVALVEKYIHDEGGGKVRFGPSGGGGVTFG